MAVYFVTGKLGAGKSLCSVGRIVEYIESGRKVATNLDLKLHFLFSSSARNLSIVRIPDKPTVFDLDSIGLGNETYDEGRNGLLVLDECGTWFNSRGWADKSRQELISWFLHTRKKGWDVIFIVQDKSIIDKYAREALAEHVVYCRRLDRLPIPIIGFLFKIITGKPLPFPRMHAAVVRYGDADGSMVVDTWIYRGFFFQSGYDTKQAFTNNYPHGPYSYLTPWHTKGRHLLPLDWSKRMRLTKIYFKRSSRVVLIVSGFLVGMLGTLFSSHINKIVHKHFIDSSAQASATPAAAQENLTETLSDYYVSSVFRYSKKDPIFVLSSPKQATIRSDDPKFSDLTFFPTGKHSLRVVQGDQHVDFFF